MKPKLVIEFLNGSNESLEMANCHEARCYARDHVSYLSGRIKQVIMFDEYGNPATLWNHNWSSDSQNTVRRIPY